MDIVYLQGPHVSERELRWSLRSVAANLPHERMMFLGPVPGFVKNVASIDGDWPEKKFDQLHAKHRALAQLKFDEVVVMDDDFYVTKPVDRLPEYYTGWFFRKRLAAHMGAGDTWDGLIDSTFDFLQWLGYEGPHWAAIHIPSVYTKDNLMEIAEKDPMINAFQWRMVYSVLFNDPTLIPMDCKATSKEAFVKITEKYDLGFLSSEQNILHFVEDYLDELFPDKCDYEV